MKTTGIKTTATYRRVVGLVAVTAIAVIVGTEAIARYGLGLGDPPLSVADPEIEYLFKPGTYHRFGNRMNVNSWHMRSDNFPARKQDEREFRVLVFGDSVINGGALTDQADLATEILRAKLATALKRPVIVGNVSAGSWGPTNMLAYARKFGFFQADVVVIMLNSMDIGDNPSGEAIVGVNPAFPARRPLIALEELVRRYLWPRLLQAVAQVGGETTAEKGPPIDGRAQADKSVQDLKDLCTQASGSGAVVLLAHFPMRDEVSGKPFGGYDVIAQAAADLAVPLIEVRDDLACSIAQGKDPYRPRDSIHANAIGQRIIADVLGAAILEAIPEAPQEKMLPP